MYSKKELFEYIIKKLNAMILSPLLSLGERDIYTERNITIGPHNTYFVSYQNSKFIRIIEKTFFKRIVGNVKILLPHSYVYKNAHNDYTFYVFRYKNNLYIVIARQIVYRVERNGRITIFYHVIKNTICNIQYNMNYLMFSLDNNKRLIWKDLEEYIPTDIHLPVIDSDINPKNYFKATISLPGSTKYRRCRWGDILMEHYIYNYETSVVFTPRITGSISSLKDFKEDMDMTPMVYTPCTVDIETDIKKSIRTIYTYSYYTPFWKYDDNNVLIRVDYQLYLLNCITSAFTLVKNNIERDTQILNDGKYLSISCMNSDKVYLHHICPLEHILDPSKWKTHTVQSPLSRGYKGCYYRNKSFKDNYPNPDDTWTGKDLPLHIYLQNERDRLSTEMLDTQLRRYLYFSYMVLRRLICKDITMMIFNILIDYIIGTDRKKIQVYPDKIVFMLD